MAYPSDLVPTRRLPGRRKRKTIVRITYQNFLNGDFLDFAFCLTEIS